MATRQDRDAWLNLADRHLHMADQLGGVGLHDGGVFHAYHAFECFISAGLAARGREPSSPPTRFLHANRSRHVAKLDWFNTEYKGQALASAANALRTYLCGLVGVKPPRDNDLRNACLYYHRNQLLPWQQFDDAKCRGACKQVNSFVKQYRTVL